MFQMLKNLARMNRTVYGRNAKKKSLKKKKNLLYPLSLICFTFGKPSSSVTSLVIDLVDIVATVQISLSRSSSSSSLLALSDSYTLSLLATGFRSLSLSVIIFLLTLSPFRLLHSLPFGYWLVGYGSTIFVILWLW